MGKRFLIDNSVVEQFGDLPLDLQSVLNPDVPLEILKKFIDGRGRNWAFIVYPESAPVDWIQILNATYCPWACSPLHDKDLNSDGSIKKAHYHVIMTFEGNKSFSQLFDIGKSVNATFLQLCDSVRGAYRYFTHQDNPEKYQYNEIDIKCHNGFDASNFEKTSTAEKVQAICDMQNYIDKYNITSFYIFNQLIRRSHYDWFKLVSTCCGVIIKEYISSRRFYIQDVMEGKILDDDVLKGFEKVIDQNTGAISYVQRKSDITSDLEC